MHIYIEYSLYVIGTYTNELKKVIPIFKLGIPIFPSWPCTKLSPDKILSERIIVRAYPHSESRCPMGFCPLSSVS